MTLPIQYSNGEATAQEVLADAAFVLDQFGACAMNESNSSSSSDDEEDLSGEEEPLCCTGVSLSTEERLVLQWFRESHSLAKDAIKMDAPEDEPFDWVDMPVDDSVAVVTMTQERMQEIGLVLKNGDPPTRESPARLFWIQAKPTNAKSQFGLWDPVGAQWKLFPGRAVVPIEQRIAPCGVGCCGTGQFTDADYGDEEAAVYTGTALEAALPHVRAQVRSLPTGSRVSVASGWGTSAHSSHAYYTPHLRHVAIDRSIREAGGKKYIYKFPIGARVAPTNGQYAWNSTNSCWVYRTTSPDGPLLPESSKAGGQQAEYMEQSRDLFLTGA